MGFHEQRKKMMLLPAERWVFETVKSWADGTPPQTDIALGVLGTNLAAMADGDCQIRYDRTRGAVEVGFGHEVGPDCRSRIAEVIAAGGGGSRWHRTRDPEHPSRLEICRWEDRYRLWGGKARRLA